MDGVKTYLKRAKQLESDIKSKQREKHYFYTSLLQSPSINSDMVQESRRAHHDDKYILLMELGEKIDQHIEQLCVVWMETTGRIDRMDDGMHKAILRDFYLNNLTWEKIADVNEQSVRNVYSIHRKALVAFKEVNAEFF